LAALDTDFSLGFVGVAGKTGDDRLDFLRWFASHNVDFTFGRRDDESLSGTCISFIQDGERSLLTCPGANFEMAQHLSSNYDAILGYLSRAKVLHVTSFFDSKTPSVLSTILRDAKRQNPLLKLSFDPGYEWLDELSLPVRDILAISDVVFLNESEFRLLSHDHPGDDDRHLAQSIFSTYGTDTAIIILKQSDKISIFRRVRGRIFLQSYRNLVLTPDEIEDATGAGDVFAGGFLTSLLIPGVEIREGVELGLRLVRRKLVQAGSSGFSAFPAIFNRYLDELTAGSPDD
jgi:sugar/nucleoside kinase (ribokinase family)